MDGFTLDVGCGFTPGVHKKRGTIGLDLWRGTCDIVGDAQKLPFRNRVFDRIFLYAVLEHLGDPLTCLKEVRRVAKDNAHFEIVIPVEARFYIADLKCLFFEFPFSVLTLPMTKWRSFKERKTSLAHKNRIQPKHISHFLKITKIEIQRESHSWFRGRKGRLLKKIFRNPPALGSWKNWYIEATKTQ